MLNQETPENGSGFQFMMDGEVVWRVNRDYAAIECYQERPLRQSGTFLLVKSVYKPTRMKIILADAITSLHAYRAVKLQRPLYRVTQKGHGVRMRKYSSHDDSREMAKEHTGKQTATPRTLKRVTRLPYCNKDRFYWNSSRSRLLWCNVSRTVNPPENLLLGLDAPGISGT
ncbi:hypothetical protein ACLBOM_36860 [Escherichia coli]